MAEESTEKDRTLKRYRVKLDGNRGETVMKLTEEHADRMGDRVLGEADSDQIQHGMPQGETKHADQTASGEEEDAPQRKARTASNKKKSADDK